MCQNKIPIVQILHQHAKAAIFPEVALRMDYLQFAARSSTLNKTV